MTRALLALALILTVLAAASVDGAAAGAKRRLRSVTERDVAVQSGATDAKAAGAAITDTADPFAFRDVGGLRRLTQVTITLTITDGDTGPGEFDEGELVLALDGVDTGIALDGFRNLQTDTRTIGGAPANAWQILAALKADGELVATVIDRDPVDDNEVTVPANVETKLTLKGKQVVKGGRR